MLTLRAPVRTVACEVPVVLAPMAGVTDVVFRRLCRRRGPGLFVCEMVHARLFAEGDPHTVAKVAFDPDERPRSAQVYATCPEDAAAAVARLVEAHDVDHVDLNFGCPAPKVLRRGGGAAIPADPPRFRAIVRAAVRAAAGRPVTVKMRMGLSDAVRTDRTAACIAAEEGVAAVALHARTAADRYAPGARWDAIATLVETVAPLPVLGNGDVFSAGDALAMVARTGCAGVVVGRGCLGRPWLFAELAAAFAGRPPPPPPTLRRSLAHLVEHARAHVAAHGPGRFRSFRRHGAAYLAGYPSEARLRPLVFAAEGPEDLARLFDRVRDDEPLVRRGPPRAAPVRTEARAW